MSWINPDIELLKLAQEVEEIQKYIGFYQLVSTTGMTINNVDNVYYNVSSPASSSIYAFSTTTLNDVWQITFDMSNNNSNMFVGISQNLTQSFAGASFPSMKMVDYGMLIDQNYNNKGLLKIENGIFSTTSYNWGSSYKITYDGSKLTYFVNNINLMSYTVNLSPIYLIVGSVAGGQVYNIRFEGAGGGGGGGGAVGLSAVLAVSGDGGNGDITNVDSITANTITSKGYLQIGNTIGPNTSQLHLFYGDGTENGNNWQMVGSALNPSQGKLDFQYYTNNTLSTTPLTITSSLVTSPFTMSCNNFQVYSNGTDGYVFDTLTQPSFAIFESSVTNITTKQYSCNTPTSILQFNIAQYEYLNNISLYFNTLTFTFNVMAGSNNNLQVILYLSPTLNGDIPDLDNPLNVIAKFNVSSPNSPLINVGKLLISYIQADDTVLDDGIYLNVKTLSQDNTNVFQLTSLGFASQLTASFVKYNNSFTPVVLT